MRAAIALYALRFGGWLLAKATRRFVHLIVEIYDADDLLTLERDYNP